MKLLNHKATSKKHRGATLIEYVFIVVLIAMAGIVMVGFFGEEVKSPFEKVDSTLKANNSG